MSKTTRKDPGKGLPAPKFTRTRDGGVRLGDLKLRADYFDLARIEDADGGRAMWEVLGRLDHVRVQIAVVRILGGFETDEEAAEAAVREIRRHGSLQLGMALGAAVTAAMNDDEPDAEPDDDEPEGAPGEP